MRSKNIAAMAIVLATASAAIQDATAGGGGVGNPPPHHSPSPTPSPSPSPSPVVPPSPTANPATFIASNSFTANWSTASRATGYLLDVSRNNSFSTYVGIYHNRDVGNMTNGSVTGLNANTTYYYRVRAYNGGGISGYSNIRNVTTLSSTAQPVVLTNPATLIAGFSATLNGSVDPNGLATTVYFQWGPTTNYTHTTVPQSKTGHTYQNVSRTIARLNANTTYHYQIVGTYSGGMTFGLDRTFTTRSASGPPIVITNPATNVGSSSATLNGAVDPHGKSTTVKFKYGTTTFYEHTIVLPGSQIGNTYRNVMASISGLSPNTLYHFKIVAINNEGIGKGSDQTFTTLGGPTPTATYTPTPTSTATYTPTPTATYTPTPSCTPSAWTLAANMPTDLYGAAGASDGTYFYAAGGYSFSQSNTLAVVNRYDPSTNTWTPMANMPQAAIMATAVYYPPTNKIFVFGGEDSASGTNYNITRIYDIATNTWTTGANMPDLHSFAAGGYIPAAGKIYIISGYNSGQVTSAQPNTWAYDPVANTWQDLTGTIPFPHPAGGTAFGVINNKLYVAGGRDAANTIINLTWEFDPVAGTYTAKADESGTFQNNVPGSAAAQNLLWVFGGGNPFIEASQSRSLELMKLDKAAFPWARIGVKPPSFPSTANDGRTYNPATNTWSNSANMNLVRSFPSGGAIGNNLIIAAGGYNGSTTVASTETEGICGEPTPTPTATPGGTPTPTPTCAPVGTPGPWTQAAVYPISVYGAAVASDGTSIYGFGGNGAANHAEAYKYNSATNMWTPLASMTTGVDYLAHAEYGGNGKIYVMGGINNGTLNRVYNIAANIYSAGAPVPVAVYDHGHAYYNGKIYVIGGIVSGVASSAVYAYDVATNTWSAPLASLPQAEFNMACGAINNKIYCANGSPGSGQINNLFIYDIAANSWTSGPASPQASNYPAGTVIGGKLYMIGGGDPFAGPAGSQRQAGKRIGANAPGSPQSFTNTFLYDPVANSWSAGPSLITARSFADAATVNTPGGQTAVVVGGYNSTQADSLNSVERSTLAGCP